MLSPATSRAPLPLERQPSRKQASRRGSSTTPLLRIVDASTEGESAELNNLDSDTQRTPASPVGRAILHLLDLPKVPASNKAAAKTATSSGRTASAESRDESALAAYLKQLRGYPLLAREEEHELAVAFRRTGDLSAAARLVTANLRLVVKLARDTAMPISRCWT